MSFSIFQDFSRNKNNIKSLIILFMFRVAQIAKHNLFFFILMIPYLIFYRVFVEWILGTELPYKTVVGKGLVIHHGQSLVINDNAIIGLNCTLRHCVTIGNKSNKDGSFSKSPILGNNVDVGANVCIIGPITIGDNVIIGAGSVVVKNVPSNSIIAGNPARIISTNSI